MSELERLIQEALKNLDFWKERAIMFDRQNDVMQNMWIAFGMGIHLKPTSPIMVWNGKHFSAN